MKIKNTKQEKGITLIALVITIIVLLILAGISISMISNQNGILNKATKAKEDTERVSIEEKVQLAYLSALTEGTGNVNYGVLNEELANLGFDRGVYDTTTQTYSNDIKGLPKMVKINEDKYTITAEGKCVKRRNMGI